MTISATPTLDHYKGKTMKSRLMLSGMAAIAISYGSPTSAQEALTGDSRDACEAILCLAAPTQPAECAAAITRYFSFAFMERPAFLNKCPAAQQTAQMATLTSNVSQIVQYGSACDTATLASQLNQEYSACQATYNQCQTSYRFCIDTSISSNYDPMSGFNGASSGTVACSQCYACNPDPNRAHQLCGAWVSASGGTVRLPTLTQQYSGYVWQ
ncbi:TrbM/KikA/MpfK family conjugal transfer protein [uncultured Thiodictyon sp.]|uniref:TrbM/KikA/MpfK family conjugal transfer protein n=1 Tax=uncultured Thiodictyon sp. TaxID=1846217 RepID=UPI0025E9BC93|nr:TrbM/KikA/MpfK family conjugal transfer protein [uncultured Thiodictyon sp.]